MTYQTPGVYVEEISTLPPSVAPVSTAIPAFIGYTEKRPSAVIEALRIRSFVDYTHHFGGPPVQEINVRLDGDDLNTALPAEAWVPADARSSFRMYHQVYMYFQNGGGPCYIISVGGYEDDISLGASDSGLNGGRAAAKKNDEITLLLFPDSDGLSTSQYYDLYNQALIQCAELQDRFTIIDVKAGTNAVQDLRGGISNQNLNYGAAYHPYLATTLQYAYERGTENRLSVVQADGTVVDPENVGALLGRSDFRAALNRRVGEIPLVLPPSGTVAGVYAQVDRTRGVFKAPANVSLNSVTAPVEIITEEDQKDLNIHTTGKSINAIRSFTGRGTLVWGARTLDGNSSEWKYISVRRFFLFVGESLKKATEPFVFEPNDARTWNRIKGLAENFLTQQWRTGALLGASRKQAFQVRVGLGETMTAQDVLNGHLIVEIGMAVVRPSEFIVLRFTHQLLQA